MNYVKNYEEAKQVFNKHGFNFTVESMRYLLDHHKSFAEVANINNEESCVELVRAASKDQSLDNALKVLYDFMQHGICIQLVHYMLKELAKEQSFFMNQHHLQILEEVSTTSDHIGQQDILKILTEEINKAGQELKVGA